MYPRRHAPYPRLSHPSQAWDGSAYSPEATVDIKITARDGVPAAVATSYATVEDAAFVNITLRAIDIDSEFVAVFIKKLPTHGKLFRTSNSSDWLLQSNEIGQAYSEWETVPPFAQFAANVRAVSTFWPAGDDAGNGYPSWHPFRE